MPSRSTSTSPDVFHTPFSASSVDEDLDHESTSLLSSNSSEALDAPADLRQLFSRTNYVAFFLFGLCYMSSWNVFISIPELMREKLEGSPFQDNFQNYFSFGFMAFQLSFLTLLTYSSLSDVIPTVSRIHSGFLMLLGIFVAALLLMTSSLSSPWLFFLALAVLVGLSGITTSFLASFYRILSHVHPLYIQAFQTGQGVAGLLPVSFYMTMRFFSIPWIPFFYFALPIVLSLVGYKVFRRVIAEIGPFLEQHTFSVAHPSSRRMYTRMETTQWGDESARAAAKLVMNLILGVGFIFFLTLMIFPAITTSIYGMDNGTFLSKYLVDIHFFVFNLSDLIGRTIPSFKRMFIESPSLTLFLGYARIIYIPLFFFCNVKFFSQGVLMPRLLPLFFGDLAYLIILFTFGLTNGWFTTNLLMQAPLFVHPSKAERIGELMVYGLTVGLTAGSGFSFILRALLCKCNSFSS